MTTLRERLQADRIKNYKARNELETTTLRNVLGAIQTQETAGKTRVEFGDAEILDVIAKEVKKRRDTAAEYTQRNVLDRAARETAEADFLAQYLPVALTEAEIDQIVAEAITSIDNATMKDFGAIMKIVVAATKGRADGKVVSDKVRAQLT